MGDAEKTRKVTDDQVGMARRDRAGNGRPTDNKVSEHQALPQKDIVGGRPGKRPIIEEATTVTIVDHTSEHPKHIYYPARVVSQSPRDGANKTPVLPDPGADQGVRSEARGLQKQTEPPQHHDEGAAPKKVPQPKDHEAVAGASEKSMTDHVDSVVNPDPNTHPFLKGVTDNLAHRGEAIVGKVGSIIDAAKTAGEVVGDRAYYTLHPNEPGAEEKSRRADQKIGRAIDRTATSIIDAAKTAGEVVGDRAYYTLHPNEPGAEEKSRRADQKIGRAADGIVGGVFSSAKTAGEAVKTAGEAIGDHIYYGQHHSEPGADEKIRTANQKAGSAVVDFTLETANVVTTIDGVRRMTTEGVRPAGEDAVAGAEGVGEKTPKVPVTDDQVGMARRTESPKVRQTVPEGYTVRGNPQKMLMENQKARRNWNDAADAVLEKKFEMGSPEKNRIAFENKIDSLPDGPEKIGNRLNPDSKSGFSRTVSNATRKRFYQLEADPARSSSLYTDAQRKDLARGKAPDPRQQMEHLNDLVRNPKGALNPDNIYMTEGGLRGGIPKDSPHGQKTSKEPGSPGERLRNFQKKHAEEGAVRSAADSTSESKATSPPAQEKVAAPPNTETGNTPRAGGTGKRPERTTVERDRSAIDAVTNESPSKPSQVKPESGERGRIPHG